MGDIAAIIEQVKLNCNISDARFWGYYSICGLLMRYRELYRSEKSLMPWDSIENKEVCQWIQEREKLWNELEDSELQNIVIEGRSYNPFDIDGINTKLKHEGLIYGSGYGTFNKPTFFVAELRAVTDLFDYRVHYAGVELCRDLAAASAMLQGRCIYVRPEVLTMFIWDRFQELKANRAGGLAENMFSYYEIKSDDKPCPELYGKIVKMAADASEVFIMHEAGEAYEDEYSDDWHEILCEGCGKPTELFLRGIKDIRADTSLMGPLNKIILNRDISALVIFISFMDGIRREIFPEIKEAYQRFTESGDWTLIEKARAAGYRRSSQFQEEAVGLWRKQRDRAVVARYISDTFQQKKSIKH